MASNEDMVPTDLPYGARQETKAAMKVAGIPTSSASGRGGSSPAQPTAAAPLAAAPAPATPVPVSGAEIANYDVFANRQPTTEYQPVNQRQVMMEKVRQSPNAVMQAIYSRMAGYKEG